MVEHGLVTRDAGVYRRAGALPSLCTNPDGERIAEPRVRAVIAAPVALRAGGASWIRHWETLLGPALKAVGGEIVSSRMSFARRRDRGGRTGPGRGIPGRRRRA